jgi:beta-glucosidase
VLGLDEIALKRGHRFGLVCVDFKTHKRTPKLSASFFRETVRRHAVV